MGLPTQNLFSIPFVSATFREVLDYLVGEVERKSIEAGRSLRVITANPEMLMLARKEKRFLGILRGKDRVIVPDGIGVILAGKILGIHYPERIAGYDLMTEFLRIGAERGLRIYLLGSTPETIEAARTTLESTYPTIQLRVHHGYFTSEEEEEILKEIRSFRPHLLFTGLGVPKQEYWLEEHLPNLPVALSMGVGGSFDVLAGKVKRAPLLWRRLGVEWLYRLLQEPWRWRRMKVLPHFLLLVVRSRIWGVNLLDRS